MKWSRELRIARRSVRTVIKAAAAMATATSRLPSSAHRPTWATTAAAAAAQGLLEVSDFGSNPGRLSMLVHLPSDPPPPRAPLIVLLHGCGQSAAGFAAEGGWIALGDQLRVPLVLPEQSDANN